MNQKALLPDRYFHWKGKFCKMDYDILIKATFETLYMTFFGTLLGYIIGFPLGIFLVTSSKKGIAPMPKVNAVVGWIVNIGRSIPFIILIAVLVPVTRMIMGKAIGTTAMIFPLLIGSAPFIARMVETSLEEINQGVIEAAQVMGASNFQIILKVMIPEALPSLIRGASISTITIMTYTAMAGAMGGGGLGNVAIVWGYNRFNFEMLMAALILIIIIVQVIQILFQIAAKAVDKRIRSS